ncbi:MAG: Inner membrane protein YbiR [Candidatus Accumulibacter sp. SK-11]|nr:MAG: Inner membrane protein YbiR [Candidatus Accumulibacter sp. SK-11]
MVFDQPPRRRTRHRLRAAPQDSAVNVGGFGLLIGSLANLIAIRLLGRRHAWWRFHAWSQPFLGVVAGLA